MDTEILQGYDAVRLKGNAAFHECERGLISVWGKEAVQFLDGLITNDIKTLPDGEQMFAAFPNAQGRLLAVVRVKRDGERLLFDTEAQTREKLYQNLFRFTFAGDFFVEDLSDQYRYFAAINQTPAGTDGEIVFRHDAWLGIFVPTESSERVRTDLARNGIAVSDVLYDVLRIESGIPKYGVDMDETTIVPELGTDDLISYTKGCYIGQEIIARIHFRGHVAKQLTGLVFSGDEPPAPDAELTTTDGRNAGRVTSSTFSPKLGKHVALAYIRYEHLAAGTSLRSRDIEAVVAKLPFI